MQVLFELVASVCMHERSRYSVSFFTSVRGYKSWHFVHVEHVVSGYPLLSMWNQYLSTTSSTLLYDKLHWLHMQESHIQAWRLYHSVHGQAPRHLADYITPASEVASRLCLHSTSPHQLIIPHCQLNTYGRRAFLIAGQTRSSKTKIKIMIIIFNTKARTNTAGVKTKPLKAEQKHFRKPTAAYRTSLFIKLFHLLIRQSGTHYPMITGIQHAVLTVLNSFLRQSC